MKIIKNKIVWTAAVAALTMIKTACALAQLVELNYNEDNGSAHVINSAGGSDYQVNFYAGKNPPERVPGVSGNALRTDGYSTCDWSSHYAHHQPDGVEHLDSLGILSFYRRGRSD